MAESYIDEVVPTADGGAYVVSYGDGVWYVRASEAVKVSFQEAKDTSGQEDSPTILGLEITPTADGGAIATGDKVIWYLREASAVRVIEASQLTSAAPNTSARDKYFSLYIAELKRRRATEQAETYRDAPEDERDEY